VHYGQSHLQLQSGKPCEVEEIKMSKRLVTLKSVVDDPDMSADLMSRKYKFTTYVPVYKRAWQPLSFTDGFQSAWNLFVALPSRRELEEDLASSPLHDIVAFRRDWEAIGRDCYASIESVKFHLPR